MGQFARSRASEKEFAMNYRFFVAIGAVAVAMSLAPLTAVGQTQPPAKGWTLSHTPDGQPDIQGVWDYRTLTPLERPKELGTKAFFTKEEAAKYEKEQNLRENRDLIDPEKGGLQYPPGGVVPYNEVWYDRGNKIVGSERTSLIVDPADGRLPPWTPEGEKQAAHRKTAQHNDQVGHLLADSWEDRPLQERCLVGLNAGPPMIPGAYNNNVQLFQTPGYVVILNEMVHSARIVPLDAGPHGGIPQWKGDSRGHWEGHTLVVDTVNFKRETSLDGSSAHTHLVERFTRVDAHTLLYEFTVDDPTMWTRPWTAQVLMSKSEEPIYEYACHEGNYALHDILAGARAAEKTAQETNKKGSE
jgi:hypothetical protein